MRKALWGCVAFAVLAATGVYLAAHHAARHPDSFLGRVAAAISPHANSTCGRTMTVCAPVQQTTPQVGRGLWSATEPIVVIPDDAPEPPAPTPLPPTLPVIGFEEESAVPPMPFVDDEEVRMPYADEEELPEPAIWHPDNDEFEALLQEARNARSESGMLPVTVEILKAPAVLAEPCVGFETLGGLFLLPGHFVHTAVDTVCQTLRPVNTTAGNGGATEEEAEKGAQEDVSDEEAVRRYHDHHRQMYCPYTGCPCPVSYRIIPATTPPTPPQVGTTPAPVLPLASPRQ